MPLFTFTDTTEILFSNDDVFITYLRSGISNEDELFDELTNSLQFPSGYFGRNYNALYDCLSDFYGITQKKITLIHHDLPFLGSTSLQIYLEVLIDAVKGWREWNLNPKKSGCNFSRV